MAKIRLTKNELKIQKEALKRFQRFLPTLELKKTQLINEIRVIRNQVEEVRKELAAFETGIDRWIAVFGDDIDLGKLFSVKEIVTRAGNIAGIDLVLFEDVVFHDEPYDLYETPLWIDRGINACKHKIEQNIRIKYLEDQIEVLREELRITTQRVNLFEKVKIPESKENIRRINIYLGDERTTEVVRGKISKAKIHRKKELAAA